MSDSDSDTDDEPASETERDAAVLDSDDDLSTTSSAEFTPSAAVSDAMAAMESVRARARATATGASTKNADAEGIAADDEKFMRLALHEATLAAHALEVPVGAVLVEHATGTVLASHHNSTLREEDPTAHAELKCIREGAKKLGSWQKLAETTLYVTLEPCPMCAGAIAHARIRRLYFAATDQKGGAVESGVRFFDSPTCHHKPEIYGGIQAATAQQLLNDFFAAVR